MTELTKEQFQEWGRQGHRIKLKKYPNGQSEIAIKAWKTKRKKLRLKNKK